MKRVLLPALLVLVSCTSSLRDDYEKGAVTPYASEAIAESRADGPSAREGAAAPDPELAKAMEHLDALAAEWKARAAREPAGPGAFGLPEESGVTEDDLEARLTPARVFAAAHAMSPAIRSAREALRATVNQFDQVAYLDAILRQYESFTKDLDLRIGAPRQKERIEAYFPFPGTMSLKTRIVAEEAKAAEERLDRTVRETLVAAGKSYYEAAWLAEAIDIVAENVELLRGMAEIAESRYGVGKARQTAVLRLNVEIASLEDRLVTLRERYATERSRLASILGLPANFAFGAPETPAAVTPPSSPKPLYPLARDRRQELGEVRAKIAGTESLIELAETKAYPALSPDPSRSRKRSAGMPKYWYGEAASFIQEMKDRLAAMKQRLEDASSRTDYLVKDSWFKWDAAWRQVELYRTSLLPQAEQSYQVLESGWQEGVADFLDALDAQRTWLRYRLLAREAVKKTNSESLSLIDALGTKVPADDRRK